MHPGVWVVRAWEVASPIRRRASAVTQHRGPQARKEKRLGLPTATREVCTWVSLGEHACTGLHSSTIVRRIARSRFLRDCEPFHAGSCLSKQQGPHPHGVQGVGSSNLPAPTIQHQPIAQLAPLPSGTAAP
jgi:hypothetical protein